MPELKRTLTVWRGTGMFLNIVLGAGLLTLPGLAAQAAGAGALWVWAACALAAAPLLAVFAILGRRFPNSGGLAGMLRAGFGDTGYIAGTLLFLGAVVFGLPAIALTGGHYAAAMLGGGPAAGYAALLLLLATGVNLISAEKAGRLNAALASLLIVVLLGVAAVGWALTTPGTAHLAEAAAAPPSIPVFGMVFMMVFFAFTGWEVGANLSGEFKRPERDFPIALGLSFVTAVALYAILALVVQAAGLTGGWEAPFATLFAGAFGAAGGVAISAISVLLVFANLSAAVWAVSRMVYAAAREDLLPAALTDLRHDMPWRAVLVTVGALLLVVAAAGAGLADLGTLLGIAGQNFLLLYAGAAAVLVRLAGAWWHAPLGLGCLALTAGLVAARGVEGMIYPLVLLGLAGAIAMSRRRRPSGGVLRPGE